MSISFSIKWFMSILNPFVMLNVLFTLLPIILMMKTHFCNACKKFFFVCTKLVSIREGYLADDGAE